MPFFYRAYEIVTLLSLQLDQGKNILCNQVYDTTTPMFNTANWNKLSESDINPFPFHNLARGK